MDLKCPWSENVLTNLNLIDTNKTDVHNSHVSGRIVGFAHDFCNLKVRENYYTIPVIAHNKFRFDFFFFLKGIRPTVWETTQIKIGAKNASNINFAVIGSQVRFIDTIKCFQQSLSNLGASMTRAEKENLKINFERVLAYRLLYCNDLAEREWILDYLTSGKGTIPYQIITKLDSLSKTPDSDFFSDIEFENTWRFKQDL